MSSIAREKPHNIDAEESVLGSVLIDPMQLHRVSFLRPNDFFLVKNRWVWEAIGAVDASRKPIDYLTVCDELDRRGQIVDIGGQSYISHLINCVPTAIHAEGYARIVEQTSIRRGLLAAASSIAMLAYDEKRSIDEIQSDAVTEVVKSQRISTRSQQAREVASEILDQVDFYYNNPIGENEVRGLSTGIRAIDKATGGLEPGLILLAARPSMGKSALVCQIAESVAMQGKRVLIHTIEMSNAQVLRRLACGRAQVNWLRVKQGRDDDKLPRFIRELVEVGSLPIIIDDSTNVSTAQIRSSVATHNAVGKLDLVIVDHIGLVSDKAKDEVIRLNYVSSGLKAIAKDFSLPVIGVHQLNRAVESRASQRPVLTDLRDSGHLEQNADIVMMLYREKYYSPGIDDKTAEIIIVKNRDGEMHALAKMVFKDEYTRFEPCDTRPLNF